MTLMCLETHEVRQDSPTDVVQPLRRKALQFNQNDDRRLR